MEESSIKMSVARHKDEYKRCGYKLLYKKELTQSHYVTESTSFGTRNYRIAIFPRPAILLGGCLLRDSVMAKAVRAYLIKAEQEIAPAIRENVEWLMAQMPLLLQRLENVERWNGQIPLLLQRLENLEKGMLQMPTLIQRVTNLPGKKLPMGK